MFDRNAISRLFPSMKGRDCHAAKGGEDNRSAILGFSLGLTAFLSLTPIEASAFDGLSIRSGFSSPVQFAQRQKSTPQKAREDRDGPDGSLETRFWNDIKDRDSIEDFQTYLDAYPDGKFESQARARLQALRSRGSASQPPPSKPLQIQPAPEPQPAASAVKDCPLCPQMILIPAGVFSMGSTEMFPFEGPVHQVTIKTPFFIGQREVTLAEWDACVAEGGCNYTPPAQASAERAMLPVTNLDWNDAKQYVAWLSKKTGKTYRLPSESEWEYAARAGGKTTYPWGAVMEKNRANCLGCNDVSHAAPTPTGSYPANGFGLYDMAGNAAEWVEDCWSESYRSAPTDGSAWTKPQCQERVLRGGSYNNDPRYLRSASRFKYDFDVRYYTNGFRVVRQ